MRVSSTESKHALHFHLYIFQWIHYYSYYKTFVLKPRNSEMQQERGVEADKVTKRCLLINLGAWTLACLVQLHKEMWGRWRVIHDAIYSQKIDWYSTLLLLNCLVYDEGPWKQRQILRVKIASVNDSCWVPIFDQSFSHWVRQKRLRLSAATMIEGVSSIWNVGISSGFGWKWMSSRHAAWWFGHNRF